jgi:hypothetical protein
MSAIYSIDIAFLNTWWVYFLLYYCRMRIKKKILCQTTYLFFINRLSGKYIRYNSYFQTVQSWLKIFGIFLLISLTKQIFPDTKQSWLPILIVMEINRITANSVNTWILVNLVTINLLWPHVPMEVPSHDYFNKNITEPTFKDVCHLFHRHCIS